MISTLPLLAQLLLKDRKTPKSSGNLMDVFAARSELRRMCRGDLLKLVASQKISKCVINDGACCFHLHYKEMNFCVSEIFGESCQLQKPSNPHTINENNNLSLSFIPEVGGSVLEKKPDQFEVHYWDPVTRSIALIGKIVERRKRERGSNLKDLLRKAITDYSDGVRDPSRIFLLGS